MADDLFVIAVGVSAAVPWWMPAVMLVTAVVGIIALRWS